MGYVRGAAAVLALTAVTACGSSGGGHGGARGGGAAWIRVARKGTDHPAVSQDELRVLQKGVVGQVGARPVLFGGGGRRLRTPVAGARLRRKVAAPADVTRGGCLLPWPAAPGSV